MNYWELEEDTVIDATFQNYLEKDMTQAKRRKKNVAKALRKQNIAKSWPHFLINGYVAYYNNLHQYSKNKIHCSCAMCAAKTNGKINKSNGPVSSRHHGTRLATTNCRYGRKNYTIAEKKKIDDMNYQLMEEVS